MIYRWKPQKHQIAFESEKINVWGSSFIPAGGQWEACVDQGRQPAGGGSRGQRAQKSDNMKEAGLEQKERIFTCSLLNCPWLVAAGLGPKQMSKVTAIPLCLPAPALAGDQEWNSGSLLPDIHSRPPHSSGRTWKQRLLNILVKLYILKISERTKKALSVQLCLFRSDRGS